MVAKKRKRRIRCKNCNKVIDSIWFTAFMTEEWSWNGEGYNECAARHSLTTDPDAYVQCSHCGHVVGTGRDFSFGEGYK